MDNRFNKLLAQCPQLPVLTPHIEPLHKTKRHDSTAGKHCVLDMHHTKSLDAFDEVVHHVHGAWRPHYGAIQLVWCPQLAELTPHIAPLGCALLAQAKTAWFYRRQALRARQALFRNVVGAFHLVFLKCLFAFFAWKIHFMVTCSAGVTIFHFGRAVWNSCS